ncbi:MAG: PAS domain S-box protein, partial [Halobacteriota archaeon]
VPNIDNFIKSGQLLTLPYTEWHIKGGTFDPDRVTHGWIEKEQEALNRGFEGLRLAGNTAWIERSLSDTFTDYEAAVNDVITEHRMIAVCPYSVEKCTGNDVIDVIRNHVGTIIKQGGTWAVVEDVLHRKGIETALQQEREELAAMNEALQSTNEELRVSNEELRYETEQRKRAEEQLRATSHYARSLLEASLDPLLTISAEGIITDVNEATEEATGYSRDELIGSDFSDYFTEPDKANTGYQQVFADGVVRDYPLAVRHRSGKITDVLYNATIFADEHGNVRGVFAAARDITERKRAEEKVRAASLYARSLLEAGLDPLVTINARGEITDVNTATENVTGYSREELIGSDFSDYFTEPDKARKGYEETFLKGLVKDYPLSICHKSGRVTDVLYNATVYRNVAGDVQGVFAAARDITERKRAEEALQKSHSDLEERTAELARSNADLNQFAYVASHDLQEPLRAVVSYLQLLEKRYAGQLDERADKYITHAVEGGQRMQALVNDLLAYSRVETRGKALQSVNLENALDGALRNLSVAIEESGAVITHDPMPELKADRAQLTQVFQNLIGNAIKFRSDAPPEVHVGAQMLDDEWRFSVTDNGIGIDMRYADRIFTIFQRLHSRRAYSGTGIGLAICKRIIERHGGRIWVESDVGNGSSFYFTLKNR